MYVQKSICSIFRRHCCIYINDASSSRLWSTRLLSSTSIHSELSLNDVRLRRNHLFEEEQQRQMKLLTRLEKVIVKYEGLPESSKCTLSMNKSISTPYHCAMHISEHVLQRSCLALVDDQPWDMNRPLVNDCTLKFLQFEDEDPEVANNAFWRTCSFILGYVLETAFKDHVEVNLCSFPPPNVHSGSFVYDVSLSLNDWAPSLEELWELGRIGNQLLHKAIRFEILDVDVDLALKIFQHDKFKRQQIPSIAGKADNGSQVTLYRMGDHVDISRGPMISSTHFLFHYRVVAMHTIKSSDFGPLMRFQGVAMHNANRIHPWTLDVLVNNATLFNNAPLPNLTKKS